jgi:putative ABC transport system permease protein
MSRTLGKVARRELRRTPGRFIALFLITFLGAGFLAGLQSAKPGMAHTADDYFAHTQLADFRLLCDFGITEDDVAAAQKLPSVAAASGGYRVDLKGTIGEKAAVYAIYSLPEGEGGGLSQLSLTAGRLPTAPTECVADAYSSIRLDDRIAITEDNREDSLTSFSPRALTVVGLAYSPAYISTARGNTSTGSGQINNFLYVPETAFTLDYYTEMSVRLTDTEGISAFSEPYEKAVEAGRAALEEYAQLRAEQRHREISEEAKAALDEAEADYDGESARLESELASAKDDLEAGRLSLDEGLKKYTEHSTRLTEGYQELNGKIAELAGSRQQLDAKRGELEAGRRSLEAGRTGLAELQAQLGALAAARDAEGDPATKAALQAQIDGLQPQADALAAQVATAEQQVTAGELQLSAGESSYAAAESEIRAAQQQLAAGEQDLQALYRKLEQAIADLDEGQELYDERSTEAYDALNTARAELDANWSEWEALEMPAWVIEGRRDFPGYSGFSADMDRIAGLTLILPWFFFLVAAIVCFTTMTRMVEEHRTQIGTLKASGYRRGQIAGIYQSYAWITGLTGGALGVVCGILIFPPAVWGAYSLMYHMGPFHSTVALLPCLIGLLGGAVFLSIATAIACNAALGKSAAELMRPRAPRTGGRVLLERARGLWRRIPFRHKVTLRNLMRYRFRFAVAVIGVAGCTALLVAGLGLRDSISGVVSLQYGGVAHSRATLILDKPSSATADTELNSSLRGHSHAYAHIQSISVSLGERTNGDVVTYLFVPENPATFDSFITLRQREGHQRLALPSNGTGAPSVIITEQLANRLGAQTGDVVSFGPSAGRQVQARIAGVTENYVYNYLYLTPAIYEALFGAAPEYGSVYLNSDLPENRFDAWLAELVATENVATALPVSQLQTIIDQVVANMDSVVVLMVLAAFILATVVLYSLITIAVMERQRELATMKVLGYHRQETAAFISRETTAMTVVGICLGLGLGLILHSLVMGSIEVSELMFSRTILPQSFIIAALFPLLCNLLVNLLVLRPRLSRLDPATSLKSVE